MRTNTLARPERADAAVIRVKGSGRALALSSDVNPVYCYFDPYEGGKQAVAEAARNVACAGGRPAAITDCLNFGSPEKPEIMWQFAECIRGMSDACLALDSPVVSGNVSFYNDTEGESILPTPSVGTCEVSGGLKPKAVWPRPAHPFRQATRPSPQPPATLRPVRLNHLPNLFRVILRH